jgi:hypothetical protein
MCSRVERFADQCTPTIVKIHEDMNRFSDLINQQEYGGEGLIECMRRLIQRNATSLDLENACVALERVDIAKVSEVVVKGFEQHART